MKLLLQPNPSVYHTALDVNWNLFEKESILIRGFTGTLFVYDLWL